MKVNGISCAFWRAFFLFVAASYGELRASIVYDNSTQYLNRYYAVTNEFGDEISLAGTARLVNEFVFEYFANFIPQGDEGVRVRFYANDGPGIFLKPSTVLYDSGTLPISTNFNALHLSLPNVQVPDTFTWTVQFSGVAQKPGDEAGLLFYNPPTVGAPLAAGRIGSYYDYWKKVGTFWTYYNFGTNPPANFGARVYANTEVVTLFTLVDANSRKRRLNWLGKYGSVFLVQCSSDLKTWTPLGTARPSANGQVEFADPATGQQPLRFYRAVRLASLGEPTGLAPTQVNGDPPYRLTWHGNPLALFEVQSSEDRTNWHTIATVRAGDDGTAAFTDSDSTNSNSRYYRAVRVVSGAERPTLQITPREGDRGMRMRWHGNPGFLYPIESTIDLVEWTFVGLAEADPDGVVEFSPPATSPEEVRFYRLVLP